MLKDPTAEYSFKIVVWKWNLISLTQLDVDTFFGIVVNDGRLNIETNNVADVLFRERAASCTQIENWPLPLKSCAVEILHEPHLPVSDGMTRIQNVISVRHGYLSSSLGAHC